MIIFSQEGWFSVSQAVAGQTTEREGASSGLPHICRPVLRRAHEINQRRQVCVSTKGDDEIFSRGPTLCKLVVIDSCSEQYLFTAVNHFMPQCSLLFPILQETLKKIGASPSRKVQFFSFNQENDSVLRSDDGRQRLEEVGIGSPRDVGAWLVRVFQRDFGQEELASQLEAFIHNP